MRKRMSETVVFCDFTGGNPNAELIKCLNYLFCDWICSSFVKYLKVFIDKDSRLIWNDAAAFYHPNWKGPEPETKQAAVEGRTLFQLEESLSGTRPPWRDPPVSGRSASLCVSFNSFSVNDECMTKNKKMNLIYFSIASKLILQTENWCSFKV